MEYNFIISKKESERECENEKKSAFFFFIILFLKYVTIELLEKQEEMDYLYPRQETFFHAINNPSYIP